VKTANTVRWIEPADPVSSVAMLSSMLNRKAGDADDHGLIALAYHADTSATRALAARAEPSHPFKEREQALFWLGQTRGAEGASVVEHYATTDADPKLRTKAIFALSQSKAPDAYAHILTMAHIDPAEHVRGESFFWLAQMDDARAKDDIIASLKSESSDKVREQAVFALSQLDDGAADEALIAILRGDYPHAVKKQALFWLGQSGSPRAMAYFDEALK
jgi:HEAT repeat protein